MVLSHELVGSGKEGVIVFNDWLADCSSWIPMHPYLDKEKFTYAFTNIRGYGGSRDMKGEYNAKEAANDAFDVADHLKWDRFHIIGFSMTGMVVERMVLDRPQRIKSEIAVGPVSARAVKMSPEDREFFLSTLTNDDSVRELAARISAHKLSRQWLDYKLMLARTGRNNAAIPGYFKMWTEDDFSEEVRNARPSVPLLVIAGEWDQEAFLEPVMRDTFMAWHSKAELTVIKNCGHCPMQETPVYLATLVERFMKKYV
ncbi:MAG: alpha/beta hydrolase [Bradyrhizobiaceae bacterium]|nr:MAG: alpha/beta hydrolase [Bradyrhizobiaceae bacterium]